MTPPRCSPSRPIVSPTPRAPARRCSATFTADPTFYDAHRLGGDVGGAGIVMPDGESAYLVDDEGRLRPYGLDTGSLGDPLPAIGDTAAGSFGPRRIRRRPVARPGVAIGPRRRPDHRRCVRHRDGIAERSRRSPSMAPSGRRRSPRTHPSSPWRSTRKPGCSSSTRPPADERASAPGVTVPPLGGEVRAGAAGRRRRTHPAPARRRSSPVTSCCSAQRTARCGRSTARRSNCAARSTLAPDTLASIRPLDDGTLLTAGAAWHHARRPEHRASALAARPGRSADRRRRLGGDLRPPRRDRAARHVLLRQRVRPARRARPRQRLRDPGPRRPERQQRHRCGQPATGTELVSFGDNEAVVSRWRLDGSGPITHLVAPGFRGWSFNPSGDRLLVEHGGAFDGYPEPRDRRRVRRCRAHPRRADQRRLARRRHRRSGRSSTTTARSRPPTSTSPTATSSPTGSSSTRSRTGPI